MIKKRQREIGEAAIMEILRLAGTYPNMTRNDIATMVIGKGLAETISPSTVSTIISCGSLEAYLDHKRQKREDFWERKQQVETTTGAQTKLSQPRTDLEETGSKACEKASPAAMAMIDNQTRIVAEIHRVAAILHEQDDREEDRQARIEKRVECILQEQVKMNQALETIAILINGMLNVWKGEMMTVDARVKEG